MRLTDYYCMEVIKPMKSHRFDCTVSTGTYPTFEAMATRSRDKRFFCYYNGVPDSFNATAQRKADKALTNGKSISSVYTPDLNNPLCGYGDVKDTQDAIILVFSGDYNKLEIFVGRGLKNNQRDLYYLFVDGELDEEIDRLRQQAKPTR